MESTECLEKTLNFKLSPTTWSWFAKIWDLKLFTQVQKVLRNGRNFEKFISYEETTFCRFYDLKLVDFLVSVGFLDMWQTMGKLSLGLEILNFKFVLQTICAMLEHRLPSIELVEETWELVG